MKRVICILLALMLAGIGLSACTNEFSESGRDTGRVAFQLQWPDEVTRRVDAGAGGGERLAGAIDCGAGGIAVVVCEMYEGSESPANYLAGASWPCSAHSGTVDSVPAGADRRVVVIGRDASGGDIFRGKKTGITVVAGQTVNAGTVTMTRISGDTFTNSLGMTFVKINPGTFWMGSPEDEPDRNIDENRHQVTLTKGYYLQTTEVTQGQWRAVMGSNPSYFSSCGDNCPVESVSWNDVQEFISAMNLRGEGTYRLPTEAEWEYSCRAGTTTPFAFGDCLLTSQANYNGEYPLSGCPSGEPSYKTIPVASFAPNAWGLYDMHGNVFEWCADWYGSYPFSPVTDPTGGTSSGSFPSRVARGGSYDYGYGTGILRSAARFSAVPEVWGHDIGFRLAAVLPGH